MDFVEKYSNPFFFNKLKIKISSKMYSGIFFAYFSKY